MTDPVADAEVFDHLQKYGVTATGIKLLRLSMLLHRAGLVDHLALLIDKDIEENIGAAGVLKMALNMAEMVEKQSAGNVSPISSVVEQKKKEPEKKKISSGIFSAGDRN